MKKEVVEKNSMKLTYRAMRSEDIKKLTPMMKAAFDEDTRMHTELLEDGPWGYDNGKLLQKMLEQERTDCQVILLEGRIIGAYSVMKNDNMYVLDLLFIKPELHSKGIGISVWNDIETHYPETTKWLVETPEYSKRNRHFYNKCGFQEVKTHTYEDGESSVLLIKYRNRPKIVIREYCEERDFSVIIEANKKEYSKTFQEVLMEDYKQALKTSVTYVAYENENYCGYIRCLTDGVYTTYCCEILVETQYRRTGVGRLLLEKVKEKYPKTCIDVLSDQDEFYLNNEFIMLGSGMRRLEKP